MHKKKIVVLVCFIFFTTLSFLTGLSVGCKNSYQTNDTAYEKEEILLCPTFDELEQNPELEKLECGCGADLFPESDMQAAITFLKKVKYAIKHKDINYLADVVVYPFNIVSNGDDDITIKSKKELLKYDYNKIFNCKMNDRLFWNWRGFFYDGIQFYINEGKVIELSINISDC